MIATAKQGSAHRTRVEASPFPCVYLSAPCNFMTTYLTKISLGKTHHFRATVTDHCVDIVQGICYNWLEKYTQGYGDNISAMTKHKELVEEKLKEGFQVTEFTATLKNTVNVYDKAKWHFSGDFPSDLDQFQGYVHTGMFIGWLIDHDLMSETFTQEQKKEIHLFKQQKLTGPKIFEQACDGVLQLDDIGEDGNRFALPYFDFCSGQYLADYNQALCQNLSSLYYVADSWDNYHTLKRVVDKRFVD